jgi:hypothetical protein
MIPEAPFFTAVATVSMTLAGFSGLLIAFRRGDQLRAVDMFHLGGIAETGLASALLALMTIPVAILVGNLPTATRGMAVVVLAFIGVQVTVFATPLIGTVADDHVVVKGCQRLQDRAPPAVAPTNRAGIELVHGTPFTDPI